MSSDSNSGESEGEQSSIQMASPFVQDTPSAHRTPRSRLVRIGSTDDSAQSSPATAANRSANNFTSTNAADSQLEQQQNSSPLFGGPLTEGFSGATPSLLLPPSRGLGERVVTNLRTQHQLQQQQQQRQAEEDAFLNALSGGKAPQMPSVVMVNELRANWEPRGGAKKPTSIRTTTTDRGIGPHTSQSASSVLIAASGSVNSCGGGGGVGGEGGGGGAGHSRPGSSSRPSSAHSAVGVGFHATTAPTAFSATLGSTANGKRLSNTDNNNNNNNGNSNATSSAAAAKRTKSPTTPTTTSTAVLFPTSEWIRAALGKDGVTANGEESNRAASHRLQRDRSDGGRAATTTSAAGAGNLPAISTGGAGGSAITGNTTSAPAAASAAAAAAGASPAPRDTAMRLHEQRVKAALRSQDEMREFSGILRRLEEDGAEVLREQRRRRQDRRGPSGGGGGGGGGKRLGRQRGRRRQKSTTATSSAEANTTTADGRGDASLDNTKGGRQGGRGADDAASDDFSDYTDADEDDGSAHSTDASSTASTDNLSGEAATSGEGNALYGGTGAPGGSSSTGGRNAGSRYNRTSARAAAEVHGAENMSRIALFKLRDRTAREWVTLQRRRLEQRRAGPTALQRHLHASQQRLQSTRTRGSGGGQGNSSNGHDNVHGKSDVLVLTADVEGAEGDVTSSPSSPLPLSALNTAKTKQDTGDGQDVALVSPLSANAAPPLQPVSGGSLAISWGEGQEGHVLHSSAVVHHGNGAAVVSQEEQLVADDACSVASAEEGDEKRDAVALAETELVQRDATPRQLDVVNDTEAAEVRGTGESEPALVSPLSVKTPSTPALFHSQHSGGAVSSDAAAKTADSNGEKRGSEDVQAAATALVEPTTGSAHDNATTAALNPLLEDERLRRELQRLLFQANEDTLYGLEQCLNSKAKAKIVTSHGKHRGTSTVAAGPTNNNNNSSVSRTSAQDLSNTGWGSGTSAPHSFSPPPAWTPKMNDRRGPSLPMPLHRSFNNAILTGPNTSMSSTVGGAGGPGGSRTSGWTCTTSRAELNNTTTTTAVGGGGRQSDNNNNNNNNGVVSRRSQTGVMELSDETPKRDQTSNVADAGAGMTTPVASPALPPLHTPSPLSPTPPPLTPPPSQSQQRPPSGITGRQGTSTVFVSSPTAERQNSKATATSLPSVSPAKQSGGRQGPATPPNVTQKASSNTTTTAAAGVAKTGRGGVTRPPRRFASLSSRKKHQRTPLPVERGVGEHAAALLQHEILLTRRHEMEAERGNTREIDRACATLRQLLPLREQLLDQDIHKGSSTAHTIAGATKQPTMLLLKDSTYSIASSAAAITDGASGRREEEVDARSIAVARPVNMDAAVDRSYHPQAILQRHRQLLYDEAVRMEARSRYAARNAYLEVLAQLARRHVSSISRPAVEKLLADAQEQLQVEAEAVTPSNATTPSLTQRKKGGSAGNRNPTNHNSSSVSVTSPSHRASPDRAPSSLSPRDKLQQLIVAHLGVLELSQWPVQEVLQHLAALYRVPLYQLHECIAEQQRRFAHTYNYEERFRQVDRALVGGAAGGTDSVLRLTLHRCRRPPLDPTRDGASAAAAAAGAKGPGMTAASATTATDTLTAAAQVMGVATVETPGEALYFVRLRVGQQSVSSSAVPLSSNGSGHGGNGGGGGGAFSGSNTSAAAASSAASSASAKVLSFLGQTLTVYLPSAEPGGGGAAARKKRSGTGAGAAAASAGVGSRPYKYLSSQGPNGSGDGGEEEEESCVVTVELMRTGVEAPLARGEVNLSALGLNTYGDNGRVHAQNVQIPLKRKGYRTAELKATLEVTS